MPDRGTLPRFIALAAGVIIAGQVLQGIIGYLIVAAVAGLVLSRFFGRW